MEAIEQRITEEEDGQQLKSAREGHASEEDVAKEQKWEHVSRI